MRNIYHYKKYLEPGIKRGCRKWIDDFNSSTLMKAIHNGIIKPQIVKGRTRTMYLESEVLKIEKKKKPDQ
jgi:hypothetical protein